MWPEVKRKGAIVDERIDAVGKRIEVDRYECVRIRSATDDRPQAEVDGIGRGARHDDVGSSLSQQITQSEPYLKHCISFVEVRRARSAGRRMTRIDCDREAAQRIRTVGNSGRTPHPKSETSVLPQCQVSVRGAIQVDRVAYAVLFRG